jgi:hypothetical protein
MLSAAKWREDEMGGACSKHIYKILVGKPEGKRPLERPRRRWKDNIRLGLMEIGWEAVDWFNQFQGKDQWRAVVNTVMNLRIP